MITLKNTVLNTEVVLGETPGYRYILEEIDWGQVESQRQTYKFINQTGVIVTSSTLETRQISITGWVVADSISTMNNRKKVLNGFVNPLQMIDIVTEDGYKISGLPESSIKYPTNVKSNNEIMCEFMITLFCPDPMFHLAKDNISNIATWLPKFHFPLIIPKDKGIIMGLRSPSLIVNVNNNGHIECGMTITFTANGTVVNPSLVNVTTQEELKIIKTMQNGESITINTNDNNKYVDFSFGGITEAAFQYLDFENSVFLKLQKGDNLLRYNADEGLDNLNVKIVYSPAYLEVQGVI